jgi:hypothetical protein
MQPSSVASSMPPPEHQWTHWLIPVGRQGYPAPGLRGRWNRGSWVVCMCTRGRDSDLGVGGVPHARNSHMWHHSACALLCVTVLNPFSVLLLLL